MGTKDRKGLREVLEEERKLLGRELKNRASTAAFSVIMFPILYSGSDRDLELSGPARDMEQHYFSVSLRKWCRK